MRNVRRRLIHSVVTVSIAGVGAISGIAISASPAHASVDTTVAIAVPGNANASQPAISGDGRFVAFVSSAVSLGANGNISEVFVHDRQLNTDELTSVNNNGDPADEFAGFAAISADGRFVAFETAATNFPGSDFTNPNIYVRDRQAGTTTNLTNNHGFATAGGNIVNSRVTISADGSTVAFDAGDLLPSDTNNRVDVYVSRGGSLTVETASGTNGVHVNNSVAPSLSADGTYLVFASDANDFVANDTNGLTDVYRKNLTTGDVVLVSRTRSGAPATGYSGSPDISDDGRYVVYNSFAQNIINQPSPATLCSHNYRYDVQTDTVDFVDITAQGREQGLAGCSFEANISPSGRYVTFASQNGALTPASYFGGVVQYLKDMQTGNLEAVSVDHVGNSGEIFSDIVFGRGDVTDVGSVVFTSTTNLSGQCCYQGVYERDQGPAATGAASGFITQDIANPRTADYIGFNIAVDTPDAQILAYSVDYGDGMQSQQYDVLPVNDDHHALTHHQYSTPGTYTVTATMIDDDDRVITTSHDVVVRAANVAPTAALAVAPSSGIAPTTVQLDATGSTDSNGTITHYDFNFGDGSANVSGTAPSANHQ